MTPEERAVLDAAIRWAKFGGDGWANRLRSVVQEYHVSRRPEHTVEVIPCSAPSRGKTMVCLLPVGHGSRVHSGRAADGSARNWWVGR